MACRRLAWNLPRLLPAQSRVRRRREDMHNSVLLENKCLPLNLERCFTVKRLRVASHAAEGIWWCGGACDCRRDTE